MLKEDYEVIRSTQSLVLHLKLEYKWYLWLPFYWTARQLESLHSFKISEVVGFPHELLHSKEDKHTVI